MKSAQANSEKQLISEHVQRMRHITSNTVTNVSRAARCLLPTSKFKTSELLGEPDSRSSERHWVVEDRSIKFQI